MGLTAPASQKDVYSSTTNAQNLYLTDYHDHSPGRGVRLTGASITPGSLSGLHIATSTGAINPSQSGVLNGLASFTTSVATTINAQTSGLVSLSTGVTTFGVTFAQPFISGTTVSALGQVQAGSSFTYNLYAMPVSASPTGISFNIVLVNPTTSNITLATSTSINVFWFAAAAA
jgi:hypothetical protein